MATAGGPKISRDGLVFAIDSDSNVRGFTKYGTSGTNNNHRAIRNLVDRSSTFSTANTSQLTGGITYYTLYGITYPEGSYSPANRQGITLGFENITSAKLYDMSRDLGYFVFDENTNTWVADSYFNGERINGHCYDTYDGQPSQHATFQADFDNIKNAFPNATHIVIGSHAAENNVSDSATKSRLESIGLPSDHTSGTRWEYVLAGKIGKPWTHHYVRENVSSAVANMVIGLPLEGKGGALTFDGTDDYISFGTTPTELQGNPTFTVEGVFKRNGTIIEDGFWGIGGAIPLQGICSWNYILYNEIGIDLWGTSTYGTGQTYSDTEWKHIVWTYNGTSFTTSNISIFVNGTKYTGGNLITRRGGSGTPNINTAGIVLGKIHSGTNNYNANGNIANFKVYNRVLSDNEVQQNYNAYKNRFNL
jgi:hypothetical protein